MDGFKRFGIYTDSDELENRAVYGIAGVYLTLERRITDYLRKYNLSPSQFNALMIIKHVGEEKGISQVEISDRLIVTASNMTRLLDKLKKEELIERVPQEKDRRVNLIKTTPKGSVLLDNAWPDYYKMIKELGPPVNPEQKKLLVQILIEWFKKLDSK